MRPREKAKIEAVQDFDGVLQKVRFLGKARREKNRCFDVDEGICMRGVSVEVEGFEFMKH